MTRGLRTVRRALGHYFTANDITNAGKQRAILLTVCGSKAYNLLRNLEKTYNELPPKLLKEHDDPVLFLAVPLQTSADVSDLDVS